MNEEIIKKWNAKVKKEDKVFHLGDVIMGKNAKENLKQIIPRLNGRIILIKGNHDHFSNETYLEAGFSEVYNYPIVYRDFYILSHEPVFLNDSMPYANIHGHVHQNSLGFKNYLNASIEVLNYEPILFDELIKKLEE